jgi:MFS family permease
MGTTTADAAARHAATPMTREEKKVVFAASLGTVFEWYDFYLYGALATIIAREFFGGLDAQAAFVFALLAFAAGFVVRPFGALLFGRIGDTIGRKYTFLATILIMGLATFVVGVLPGHAAIGAAAPTLLIVLRMLQGLALGGEYAGAVIYAAEHAPPGRRGAYTGWIQTTATLGLLLSLAATIGTRAVLGEAAFAEWGWRVPFVGSIVLLGLGVWVRLSMSESPAFRRIKVEGRTSAAPLAEAFGRWRNLKFVLVALFGLVAGQAVVWYTGHFYALFFLTNVLGVDVAAVSVLVAAALLVGTPFFVVFGTLSDRVGRKPIVLAGLLLAVLTTVPLFQALTAAANPRLAAAQGSARIVVTVDPAQCSFQGSPLARDVDFSSGCDIARRTLALASASYDTVERPGAEAVVAIGERRIAVPSATRSASGLRFDEASARALAAFRRDVADAMQAAGYPARAEPIALGSASWWKIVAILWLLVVYAAMVYGPLAAMLVELFPTRIRYTSMALPYHIGNGWFGGLMPTIAFAMVASHGNIYHGLWYPVVVAAVTLLVGALFLPGTKGRDLAAAG